MNADEKLLVEAIDTKLRHSIELGLQDLPKDYKEEEEHSFQYLHEQINALFESKAAGLTHFDGVCAAFKKVHNYKYVTDPTFLVAVEKEMTAQGIPAEERGKALDYVPAIIEQMKKEGKEWDERDAGFHPNLDEIMEVSRPGINESVIPEMFGLGSKVDKTLQQAVWKLGNKIMLRRIDPGEWSFRDPMEALTGPEIELEPEQVQALINAGLIVRSSRGHSIDPNRWRELEEQFPWPKKGPQHW